MGQESVAEDRLLHRKAVLKGILEPLAKNPTRRRRFVTEAQFAPPIRLADTPVCLGFVFRTVVHIDSCSTPT
jgi:hypothetical protein